LEDVLKEDHQADKERWRKRMGGIWRSITEDNRRRWSQLACRRLNALLGALGTRSVGVYAPVRGETDIGWFWKPEAVKSRALYFPRISEKSMTFHVAEDPEKDLSPGVFGIPAPSSASPSISPFALDAVVLPGLAFDVSGARIGSGGGYYDRLFAPAEFRPPLVGLGFAFQLSWEKPLPSGSFDVLLDWVVTDREAVRCLPCFYS